MDWIVPHIQHFLSIDWSLPELLRLKQFELVHGHHASCGASIHRNCLRLHHSPTAIFANCGGSKFLQPSQALQSSKLSALGSMRKDDQSTNNIYLERFEVMSTHVLYANAFIQSAWTSGRLSFICNRCTWSCNSSR